MREIAVLTGFILLHFTPGTKAEQKIFLGDLQPIQAKVGWDQYYVFRNGNFALPGKKPTSLMVDGRVVQKGIYAHANSELIFSIPSGVQQFEAFGVMPVSANATFPDNGSEMLYGTWAYEIWIDGKKAYESDPLCAYVKKQVPIRINIPNNSKQITLKTNSLGSGHCDWSIWADPFFVSP